MHSEVQQDHPGNCPKCGMALEPKSIAAAEEADPELASMTLRFWVSAALTVPVFLLAMLPMLGIGLVGILMDRVAYRPLRGAPEVAMLITSLGVSSFIQNSTIM